MPLNVLILIQLNPGKAQRCQEVLEWLIGEVNAKEPDLTVYHVRETEDFSKGQKTMFAHMQIKDEKALAARNKLPHHQELAKILKDEDLTSEIRYMKMSGASGFMR